MGDIKIVKIEVNGELVDAKDCSRCMTLKPLSFFRRNSNGRGLGGRRGQCRDCEKEKSVEYRTKNKESILQKARNYYAENKEEILLKARDYRKNNVKKFRETAKRSYEKNKEKYLKNAKIYREINKDKLKESRKKYELQNTYLIKSRRNKWRDKNRGVVRMYEQKRRTLKNKLPYLDSLYRAPQPSVQLDHFIPISIGHGGTYMENIQWIDPEMNASKHNKHPFEWASWKLDGKEYDDFIEKARHLAQLNALTFDEYRQFIDWCFDNPRTVDEIKSDNRRYGYAVHSIELWRESTGVQFPLPAFALN